MASSKLAAATLAGLCVACAVLGQAPSPDLIIRGAVSKELRLTLADLKQFPRTSVTAKITRCVACVCGEIRGKNMTLYRSGRGERWIPGCLFPGRVGRGLQRDASAGRRFRRWKGVGGEERPVAACGAGRQEASARGADAEGYRGGDGREGRLALPSKAENLPLSLSGSPLNLRVVAVLNYFAWFSFRASVSTIRPASA